MVRKKKEFLLGEENAETEINIFLDYYDLWVDEITDKEQQQNLENAINSTILNIRKGYVAISEDEDGDVIIKQKLQKAKNDIKEISYNSKRLTKAKRQMKNADANDNFGKMYSLMGSLSGLGVDGVESLKGVDGKVLEGLSILFLQSTSG